MWRDVTIFANTSPSLGFLKKFEVPITSTQQKELKLIIWMSFRYAIFVPKVWKKNGQEKKKKWPITLTLYIYSEIF